MILKRIILGFLWIILVLAAAVTLRPIVDNAQMPQIGEGISIDQRMTALQQFFAHYKCPDFSTEYVNAADKYQFDWKVLPIISILESTCGKHQLYNDWWGYGSASGLKHFDTVSQGIDWITGQLKNGSPYANKPLESIVRIYRSGTSKPTTENQLYYNTFLKLYKSIQ